MLIGIDAGGTKNELVLCEKDGRVVNRLTAPGSNAADLGPENAAMRIASQVRALVDGHTETVDALFAGLSGGGAPAISGEVRKQHKIDTTKCLKCGACIEKCRFGAITKN